MLLNPKVAHPGVVNRDQGQPAAMRQSGPCPLLFEHKVPAGFPSPAEGYIERTLDLNAYLVPDPGASSFVRVPDAALSGLGIREGDLLVVKRACTACSGRLVWAEIDGQRLLRELRQQGPRLWLLAHHPDYPAVHPRGDQELRILGVVTAMVRALYPTPYHRACRPV